MLVTEKSTPFFAKNESGGKGYNLYLMSAAGLPVPSWVTFGKRFFSEFIQTHQLAPLLESILQNFRQNKISAKEAEKQIQEMIVKCPVTDYLSTYVDQGLKLLKGTVFSVRSSAADEDGASHSFAGQLSSYLYVSGKDDIIQFIKLCWTSGFSERALVYRVENNIDLSKISISVVLQEMIDPEKSGVMFTVDPVAKNINEFVISSVYGVGEGIVSGALEADSFWMSSEMGALTKSDIVEKKGLMKKSSGGHCEIYPLPPELALEPSLTPGELQKLWKIGRQIHRHFNRPQDIEWAMKEGKLYILQTRPVTSLPEELMGYPNLWDNSNIIESYGGLTSPLSFSFALRNYKNVYVQFCEVLHVPAKIIKEMDSYLSHMLGCIDGRVYYNLFNWYKLVGVLPGFKQNREFMETMMGVTEGLTDEIADRIKPHPSWDTFSGKIRKFVTGISFLYYHFAIQNSVESFLKTFNKDYLHFRGLPLRRMRGDQLIQVYNDVETNMMGRWKAPIINDFLCMVHFGLLRKMTLKWLNSFDSTLQNDLLSGEGGLESAEPMKALHQLALSASKIPELKFLILNIDQIDIMEALNQSPFEDFYLQVKNYIDRFGFRCMSEMKLEEIDLMSDPTYLFVCLKNYLRNADLTAHDASQERTIRHEAEKKVSQSLNGWKKIIYFWVLKHARKAVKNRENTRFARTRIYGVARTIFQAMGEDLAQLGVISAPRDIFWLTIEEIQGIFNGTLPSYDLINLIDLRKKSYESYLADPDPRIMTRGPVYWKNEFVREIDLPNFEGQDFDLQGLPCCPGIVEGIVKHISSPQDNLELNGEILVADRTDPGWVPLYPSISGLLVERGSLLSHSAIVAREMGIPTVVSIPGLTKVLKSGMRVRIDGKAGTIKILTDEAK